MIMQVVSELGPWAWFIAGLLLLIGEVLLPGIFLVWFGLAAVTIGTLTLAPFTDVAWWPWQAQVVAFAVLSLVFVMVGNKLFPSNTEDDEASKMNDPLGRFLGSTVALHDPVENGIGRVKLGDTIWRVKSDQADIAAGTTVKVTGSDNGALVVEAA